MEYGAIVEIWLTGENRGNWGWKLLHCHFVQHEFRMNLIQWTRPNPVHGRPGLKTQTVHMCATLGAVSIQFTYLRNSAPSLNLKIHRRIHKIPPLFYNQIQSTFSGDVSARAFLLLLSIISCIFHLGFSNKILCVFLVTAVCTLYPIHRNCLKILWKMFRFSAGIQIGKYTVSELIFS